MVEIVLNIGKQKITVSFDEAKKLHRELSEIFSVTESPLQNYYSPGTRNSIPFFNDPSKFTD